MSPTIQLSGERIAAIIVTIVLCVLLPLVLAAVARRRLGVGWRYFGYGALIFFLFQVISRVPAVAVVQAVLAPQLRASRTLQLIFGIALALTAGLFEEGGRYVGYRWLMRHEEKTWSKAVMYGLGHGGLESMLLVAGLGLAQLIVLIQLSATGLESIPAEQREQVAQQLAALTAGPDWTPLLGAWERAWAISFHVALSVIVLQVFRRGGIGWLGLAILAHALLDFIAVGVPMLGLGTMTTILVTEALVAVFGAAGLSITCALRDRPGEGTISDEGSTD